MSQEARDFEQIIERPRKSFAIYRKLARRSLSDVIDLWSRRDVPFQRDDYLYQGIRQASEYCSDHQIGRIVLLDKSARPLWTGIRQYWRLAHPERQAPAINFLNPSTFKRMVESSESPTELRQALNKASEMVNHHLERSGQQTEVYPEDPLLLMDSCMHSGRAMYITKRVLEISGFSDVRTGVINATIDPNDEISADVCVTNSVLLARCYRGAPRNVLVTDPRDSMFSDPVRDGTVLQAGIEERRYIRNLVTEQYQMQVSCA